MHANLLFPTTILSIAQPTMSTQGSTLVQTAQVTDVRDITIRGGRPSGLGSFLGAILGGVAGSKVGSGSGSTAASIGGALAGGMAGQHVEQSGISRSATELTLRFENGEMRTYQVEADGGYRIGYTVKVITNAGVSRVTR
jgi:outer membrane lipoprotein SlyB